MKIGYARVSTYEQSLEAQINALNQFGCDQTFQDQISGFKDARPGLDQALTYLRKGDTFVIWKLDRLGRNAQYLLELCNRFNEQGIDFVSITEGFDTTKTGGKLMFTIFAALAEMERNNIIERTRLSLAYARSLGIIGGRPRQLSTKQEDLLYEAYNSEEFATHSEIAEIFGVSKSTVCRTLIRVKKRKEPQVM